MADGKHGTRMTPSGLIVFASREFLVSHRHLEMCSHMYPYPHMCFLGLIIDTTFHTAEIDVPHAT